MNFCKIFFLGAVLLFMSKSVFADNHDTTKTLDGEEPLPLNDPFAGDDASASTIMSDSSVEAETRNLSKYKLVGVFITKKEQFATLVDDAGEFISLGLFEELTQGLMLVELDIREAIFQKSDNSYLSINFNNQIREKNE